METTMWITKDEPSQVAPCSGTSVIISGNMFNSDFTQEIPFKPCEPQQEHNHSFNGFNYQDLDNIPFCLDDFFAGNSEQGFGHSVIKAEGQGQWKGQGNATDSAEPAVSSLHIRTEGMDQLQTGWMDTDECHSPDSGINGDAALSPNNEFGRALNESPGADLGSPGSVVSSVSSTCEQAIWGQNEVGLEIYHDLIMRHLVQDIKATCVRLSIPQDPKLWTPSDCRSWLTDMAAQYHLTQVPYENFDVDGGALCGMSLAQFAQRFPNGGETVHAQLQIWNSANEYCKRQANTPSNLSPNALSAMNASRFFPTIQTSSTPAAIQQNQTDAKQHPLQFYMHMNHYQLDQAPSVSAGYNLSTLLPSPGSCSDSGLSNDFESSDEPSSSSNANTPNSNNIHLWQFLRELLEQHEQYSHCVRWVDQSAGIFKIEDSHKLAKLWGQRKNRPAMNYDKLSRSLRQYYKKNILKKTARSQRLVYQFLHPYHIC